MNFGERLKQAREARGIEPAELARLSGLSPAQISRLESQARGEPRLSTAVRLAHVLGVPIAQLTEPISPEDELGKRVRLQEAVGETTEMLADLAAELRRLRDRVDRLEAQQSEHGRGTR